MNYHGPKITMDNEVLKELITGVSLILSGALTCYATIKTQKYNELKRKERENETPLTQHIFHSNINEDIRIVKGLKLENINEGRQLLAKDFLFNKFDGWKDPAMRFSERIDECSASCELKCIECNKIYSYAMEMFEEGMKYEQLHFIADFIDDDKISMTIFRNKFIPWNQDRIERLKRKIYDVCMVDDTYRTCNQKGSRILEALDDSLFDTIKDATFTIMKLNGELKDKKYKGYTL